jgi:hypothetical protein
MQIATLPSAMADSGGQRTELIRAEISRDPKSVSR